MRKSVALLTLALTASLAGNVWMWHDRPPLPAPTYDSEPPPSVVTVPADPATNGAPTQSEPPPLIIPRSVTDASSSIQADARPTRFNGWAAEAQLRQHPEYLAAWRAQQRLKYAPRRENTIRLLGLAPAEADAAIELAIDQELRMSQQRTQEQADADRQSYYSAVHKLIGDPRYERWQEYMASRQSRMQVDQFRTTLTGADPLRDDQVEPLISALHEEDSKLREEITAFMNARAEEYARRPDLAGESLQRQYEQRLEVTAAAHARMVKSAAPILSPSQLARFETMLELQRQQQKSEGQLHLLRHRLQQSTPPVAKVD